MNLALAILYVDSPTNSAAFYAGLLGREPVEASPTFAMFAMDTGTMLGLWSRHTVAPAATTGAGGGELVLTDDDVDACHAAWAARGITIAQPPADAEFGRNFLALDLDGHRIRVMTPMA